MRIVHRLAGQGDRIVELEIADPSRPTSELAAALVGDPTAAPPGLVVDGQWAPPPTPIDQLDIRHGSLLRVASTPPIHAADDPARVVAIVGGLRAGVACPLGDQPLVIGRAPDADLAIDDPSVSGRHLMVDKAAVRDLHSRNGLRVGGAAVAETALDDGVVATIGATAVEVVRSVDDCPHAVAAGLGAVSGRVTFNRPPRLTPAVDSPSLEVPAAAPPEPAVEPPSVAGLVLPVIAGGVMAVLFSPFMAVFTALGPVLTLGTWWERRRRARRSRRRALAEIAQGVAELDVSLPGIERAERERRRRLVPDPAETVRRAVGRSARLWERRPGDRDFGRLGVGAGNLAFAPELVVAGGEGEPAPDALELLAARAGLCDVPIEIVLAPGSVVGVVGPPEAARAVGRALLLQMVVHHGPADVGLVVAADGDVDLHWAWTRWLPHTVDPTSGEAGALVGQRGDVDLPDRAEIDHRLVLGLLDGDNAFQGRATVGRRILASPTGAAIVLVEDPHRLPAGCTTLVEVDSFGRVAVLDPRVPANPICGLGWGVAVDVAADGARRLAQLDDPELTVAGAGLPDGVPLLGLLGLGDVDAAGLTQRWAAARGTADLVAAIGADADGAVVLDLVADGPHVLVGGTTGSGKSELLRSLVASLAASADPDHLAFVLIDYKGGAAFDCCGDLPHVAGVVTDLDASLAARALRCLEAELRHREERLRHVGADNLADFRRAVDGDEDPLPRLAVVIDEFASMAADLPDFLDALVGIAQRGRSLGVHLVLATQRPAGVVTDDIRANTGCRIALRVTDGGDSSDVIGAPDAADIPRGRPGRAIARLGPGELTAFQSAIVTGRSRSHGPIKVRDVGASAQGSDEGPSDLARLVTEVRAAWGDRRLPRTPWPEPLPDEVSASAPLSWLLVDDPDRQAQRREGWGPSDGHLVVMGGPGAGSSTTLVQAATAAIAEGAHVYGIDFDAGVIGSLASDPNVGAIAAPVEMERRVRLLRRLVEEIDARRGGLSDGPPIVLLVDDLGGLGRAHDSIREPGPHDHFARIWSDGSAVGVVVVVSIRRAADLPSALAAGAENVLIHRILDPTDASRFGVRLVAADLPAGRAVRAADGALLHVARISDHVSAAPVEPPFEIGELAPEVKLGDLPAPSCDDDRLTVPFAVRDLDLACATASFRPGDHMLVLGPSRSGRTTVLETIGASVLTADVADVVVVGAELAARLGVEARSADQVARVDPTRPTVALVDNAADVVDAGGLIALAATDRGAGVHLVAADRADRVRNAYGHWINELRGGAMGLLLRPEPLDGDLVGAALPGRLDIVRLPGRGVMVIDGEHGVVQVARVAD